MVVGHSEKLTIAAHGQALDSKSRKELLRSWLDNGKAMDLADRLEESEKLQRAFREEIAERLEAPLQDYLKQSNFITNADRRSLVAEINAIIDSFGLGIVCPHTGHPSRLQFEQKSGQEKAVFRLLRIPSSSADRQYTGRLDDIFDIRLMPRPNDRIEIENKWQKRLTFQKSRQLGK